MAKFNLKSIVSKKNDTSAMLLSVIRDLKAVVVIEDENGNVLLGDPQIPREHEQAISVANEIVGWVRGDGNVQVIAGLQYQHGASVVTITVSR